MVLDDGASLSVRSVWLLHFFFSYGEVLDYGAFSLSLSPSGALRGEALSLGGIFSYCIVPNKTMVTRNDP